MINQNFINAVTSDELSGFLRSMFSAANESKKEIEHLSGDLNNAHDYCVSTLVIIEKMNKLSRLGLEIPDVTGDKEKDIKNIKDLIDNIHKITSDALVIHGSDNDRSYISRETSNLNLYEFTDNNFERVQQLINELRVIVTKAKSVDEDHKSRLLRRLEKLQSELHKRTSDLDRFWGLLGEAGAAIGKFGEDTKPFVDRVREIIDIVTRTQSSPIDSLDDKSSQNKIEDSDNDDE